MNAIILKTEKIEATSLFYNKLGLQLQEEFHENGPAHYASTLAGVHFAIYALNPYSGPERRSKVRDTMIGFEVEDLQAALESLASFNAEMVVDPAEVPWGRRAIITDPDGRPVELNQSNPSLEGPAEFTQSARSLNIKSLELEEE